MNVEGVVKRGLPSRPECEAIAVRQTGLDDFGDPYFREGLDRLLSSLARDVTPDLHWPHDAAPRDPCST